MGNRSLAPQYLSRAGFVHKELAGVYDYLPLGLKVLENIKNIIRKELKPNRLRRSSNV